jgi:ankyrin repeat protein
MASSPNDRSPRFYQTSRSLIQQARASGALQALAGCAFAVTAVSSFGADGNRANLPKPAEQQILFTRDIKPILERSCLQCHSGEKPKSKFRVDSREALLKGGESKEAAIVPGKSADSRLVLFVADAVTEMEMPPLDKRERFPKLISSEIGLLRAWIDQGANWPKGVTLVAPVNSVAKTEAKPTPGNGKSHTVFDLIRHGDGPGLAKALSDPAVLSVRDEAGNTPLIQAAFYLNAELLTLFLDKGADVNATNNAGVTALMKAVWDLDKTRLLLEHHANVNAASNLGNTALIIACYEFGAASVIEELIAGGADIQRQNQFGGNAVTAAAEVGDVEVLRILLNHGADPNSKTRIIESNTDVSALMTAAQLGHLAFVNLLLQRGADVNLTTEHGNALHFAAFTHRKEITKLLLARGVDVNTTGRRLLSFRKDTGLTALMYEALNEQNDPTIVAWLIGRGADVNARASSGDTALGLARERGNTKIVEALLAAGAKLDAPDSPANPAPLWNADQVEKDYAKLAGKAAEAGVAVLVKSGARMTEATDNRCASCHQQNLPALAWSLAADRGIEYPKQIVQEELQATIKGAQLFKERNVEQPVPVPNIASWLLIGLDAAHYPADSLTDEYAYALARHQYSDGRWITKASRAPTDYSDVTSTALAIRALKLYAPPTMKPKLDANIAKGALWLRQYQANSTEERAMQMLGLYWFGGDHVLVKTLAEALLKEQRPDGGWAQIPTLESDAYATGLALFALHQAGGVVVNHPAYEKGLKSLLSSQLKDGSWFVKTRASPVQVAIDDIFPHGKHQWISSVATGWSSMALALATPPNPSSEPSRKLTAADP